jgi:hypothetical protein
MDIISEPAVTFKLRTLDSVAPDIPLKLIVLVPVEPE